MTSARRLPFFDLRDWWLSDSRMREIFDVDNIGYTPFFPASQQPESTYPHVVYNINRGISKREWWMMKDYVYMEIRSTNILDAFEISNIMIDMASKGAISARFLNDWLVSQNKDIDFEFHCIEFDRIGDIDPSMEQGGDFGLPISFTIDYSPRSGRLITPN